MDKKIFTKYELELIFDTCHENKCIISTGLFEGTCDSKIGWDSEAEEIPRYLTCSIKCSKNLQALLRNSGYAFIDSRKQESAMHQEFLKMIFAGPLNRRRAKTLTAKENFFYQMWRMQKDIYKIELEHIKEINYKLYERGLKRLK